MQDFLLRRAIFYSRWMTGARNRRGGPPRWAPQRRSARSPGELARSASATCPGLARGRRLSPTGARAGRFAGSVWRVNPNPTSTAVFIKIETSVFLVHLFHRGPIPQRGIPVHHQEVSEINITGCLSCSAYSLGFRCFAPAVHCYPHCVFGY